MKKYNFAVIGGDFRTIASSNELIKRGHSVKVYGFDDISLFSKSISFPSDINKTVSGSDYIILPIPCLSSDNYISSPLCKRKIPVSEVTDCILPNQTVLAGKIGQNLSDFLTKKKIKYYDYFKSEEFSVKNAVPTAEGAIEIALHELPVTLNSSHCLITGYGRIAKLLASVISGFGTHISVAARRHSDLAWIAAKGYDGIYINELYDNIHKYNVIFNTVPHKIFTRDILKNASSDCLLVDLASKPGGIDFDAAQDLGLNAIWALSLPGKVAPVTAGEIITETILNIIEEYMEVK